MRVVTEGCAGLFTFVLEPCTPISQVAGPAEGRTTRFSLVKPREVFGLNARSPARPGYDQELWHKLGDYPSCRLEDSLMLFRLLREANLRMFAQLTPEEWQHNGIHAERGPMTVRDLTLQIAGPDAANRRSRPEPP